MKKHILVIIGLILMAKFSNAQCDYIPSNSSSVDTLSYSFSGGTFQSNGCAPIDPTYWLAGNGMSVTVTFVNPENYPSIRVWGMNDDDTAIVSVNGLSYPLTALSANYAPKVLCGNSPGPDGVIFSNGKLVGANSNSLGNYSYQDVQINSTGVNTITVTGISGAGWGFGGVSVNCPYLETGMSQSASKPQELILYPNPATTSLTIQTQLGIKNYELEIKNVLGEEVYHLTTNYYSLTTNIDISKWSSGIYFYQIKTEKETVRGKFVKE